MKDQGLQMQDVTYRKVLQDDKGKQKVEVEQLAGWKFLMFSGSFTTRLYVYQNKEDRTVREDLLPPITYTSLSYIMSSIKPVPSPTLWNAALQYSFIMVQLCRICYWVLELRLLSWRHVKSKLAWPGLIKASPGCAALYRTLLIGSTIMQSSQVMMCPGTG